MDQGQYIPDSHQWCSSVGMAPPLLVFRGVKFKILPLLRMPSVMWPWPASRGTVGHCAAPHSCSHNLWHQSLSLKGSCIPISPGSTDTLAFARALSIYSASAKSTVSSLANSLLIPFGQSEGALLALPPEALAHCSMIVYSHSSYNRQNLYLTNSASFP